MAASLRQSTSNESVRSLDDQSRRTASLIGAQETTAYFLPRFVRDSNSLIRAEFTNEGNNSGHQTYRFNMKWLGKSNKSKEHFENFFWQQQEKAPEESAGELVECDGDCDRMVHRDEVVQFGDCEHIICSACLHNASTSIALIDGSPGCCNQQCLADQRLVRCMRSSSASSVYRESMSLKARGLGLESSASQVYAVHLTLVHFYRDNGDVVRRQLSFEMRSNFRLTQLKLKISEYIPIHEKSSVFFTLREKFRRNDLNPLLSLDDRSLEELTNGGERLIVVVTDPGVSVFK